MAENNSPFTLGSRGSIKGMKFSTAQGTDYFATKPKTISNPRTPKQQEQRARLALCTATGQKIPQFINVAYKKRAYPKTVYNEFTSQNLVFDKIDVVFDSPTNSYVATWVPASLSVLANSSQQGLSALTASGSVVSGSIVNLPISRSFTIYAFAQDSNGVIGTELRYTNSTNASGVLSINLSDSDFNVADISAAYFSIVDSVTNEVSNFTAIV